MSSNPKSRSSSIEELLLLGFFWIGPIMGAVMFGLLIWGLAVSAPLRTVLGHIAVELFWFTLNFAAAAALFFACLIAIGFVVRAIDRRWGGR